MINKKILEAVLNSEHSDLYCTALIEEINKQIDTDNESFRKKGRALIRAILGDNVDDVLMALCGWSAKTLLKKAGILCSDNDLRANEECVLEYQSKTGDIKYKSVLVNPTTFEVLLCDDILEDLLESQAKGFTSTIIYNEHKLPVHSMLIKDSFGHPVFWYYDACYAITRPVNGITINSVEYCLDENDEVLTFDSMTKAKEYLSKQGYTEAMIEAEGIEIVRYIFESKAPFGNAILADKVNEIIKLTGEVLKITGDYSNGYTEDEYDILNGIEGLLTVYRNTIGAKEN